MSLSRRHLLLGRLFGSPPEPDTVVEQQTESALDILARARRKAPWERPAEPLPAPGGHKARVLVFDCLAYLGSPCSSCSEHCPEAGAIELDAQQRPKINVSKCTGCGDCARACPAPRTALAIGPEAS